MKYTADYIDRVAGQLKTAPDNFVKNYSLEVDLRTPPILEIVRAMDEAVTSNGLSVDTKDRLLRYSILGRPVRIFYDGKELAGSPFVINSLVEPWDNHQVLVDNPTALRVLFDFAVTAVMEKWLPPQVGTRPAAAKETPGPKGS